MNTPSHKRYIRAQADVAVVVVAAAAAAVVVPVVAAAVVLPLEECPAVVEVVAGVVVDFFRFVVVGEVSHVDHVPQRYQFSDLQRTYLLSSSFFSGWVHEQFADAYRS